MIQLLVILLVVLLAIAVIYILSQSEKVCPLVPQCPAPAPCPIPPNVPVNLWGINSDRNIYVSTGTTTNDLTQVTWTQTDGSADQVQVGGLGVFVRAGTVLYSRNGITSSNPAGTSNWSTVPTPPIKDFAVGAQTLWIVGTDNSISYRVGSDPATSWTNLTFPSGEPISNLVAGGLGVFAITQTTQTIYRRTNITATNPIGDEWSVFGTGYSNLAISNTGIWGIDTNGQISVRTGLTAQTPFGTGWSTIDNGGRTYISISANQYGLWAVATDGTIWALTGFAPNNPQSGTWSQVQGILTDISVGELMTIRNLFRRT